MADSLPRRGVLVSGAALGAALGSPFARAQGRASGPFRRVRPGDAGWPSLADWQGLSRALEGRFSRSRSPFADCASAPGSCGEAAALVRDTFAIGDDPALTQASGWADGWRSVPSAFVVDARKTADVVTAVDFARRHRLRLVVKGGGHAYQGTSCAPDSLLIWTRPMRDVVLHDEFRPEGCGTEAGRPAASIGAGALWLDAYRHVTTRGGRYVQGGGCTTVGVAGLIQGGGFGSFSKRYGLAAGGLIEAEIVTADGRVLTVNRCSHPDLFWALKGGGGGSFGVVTRLTLRTHELPETFGAAFGRIRASSPEAYGRLIARFLAFYAEALFNPHWGEQVRLSGDDTLRIEMVFQGLDQARAEAVWRPFLAFVAERPGEYQVVTPLRIMALPARRLWDGAWLGANAPGLTVPDRRSDGVGENFVWAGDARQAGQFMHGYASRWLPAALLAGPGLDRLADALFRGSRHWSISLHLNKGLAGAPPDAVAAARDAAIHPCVADAFALAISAAEGAPAYPGMPGPGPDLPAARQRAARVRSAMDELRAVAPDAGSYVSESDYFESDWQNAFWGANYDRLLTVKRRYDPDGLFFVHHGVGSEGWSQDGFERN